MGFKNQVNWTIILGCVFLSSCEGVTFEEDLTLTLEQKERLDQFKSLMLDRLPQDYMKKDSYLIKWLRTKDFNIPEAEKFLVKNLDWRKEQRMDTINQEDWSDMKREFSYSLEGRDRFARSVLYLDVSGYDVRKALLEGREDRLLRYTDSVLEEACTLVRHLGDKYKNITRGHLIMDVKGFNIVQHGCIRCIPALLRILVSVEDHYPECGDQIILINVPAVAEPLFNAARPLLSRNTRQSLKVYGTNPNQWKKAMSEVFDFNELPPSIGGTKIYKDFLPDYNTDDEYNSFDGKSS